MTPSVERRGVKRSSAQAFQNDRKHSTTNATKPGAAGKTVDFFDDDTDHGGSGSLEGSPTLRSPSVPPYSSPRAPRRGHAADSPTSAATPSHKARARSLLEVRKQLPIWAHREAICGALRGEERNVLLLVGETGSGKSTQVPQFLAAEGWCRRRKRVVVVAVDGEEEGKGERVEEQVKGGGGEGGKKGGRMAKMNEQGKGKREVEVGGCIAVTQPRRVAATSLAKRVADEMGTACGRAGEVGYSVRFDVNTGKKTRIKFLTEGMLLMELLRDPWLREYSAVVVDEVHERSVGVDLCLGFLRELVSGGGEKGLSGRGGVPLKMIVMSATADMSSLERFLVGGEKLVGNGARRELTGEEFNGFSDDDNESLRKETVTALRIPGRLHPVAINYLPAATPDIISAALDRIINIHTHTPLPGDVLVFLPGQETIESLLSLLNTYSTSLEKTKTSDPKAAPLPSLLLLPLYAALPPHQQQLVFHPTPKFTRKIILSTNIAETSLTVPGIRHVIDSGLAKQRLFRPTLAIDSLLVQPISRSSATQRAGRAGRDAPGTCWRLYTEQNYYELQAETEPEVLRCDLMGLVLTLKAHGVRDLKKWGMLTKPPRKGLQRAFAALLGIGALDAATGGVTKVGREMSAWPLPGNLARVVLASEQYGCVGEIVDVVAALSVGDIFLNIHEGRNQRGGEKGNAESEDDEPSDPRLALRTRLHRREGDHLTLLATVQAYTEENSDRKRWCIERGISHRAMQNVMDVRKQLGAIMTRRSGGTDAALLTTSSSKASSTDLNTRILKCLLVGLHPNVARLAAAVANGTAKPSSKKNGEASSAPPQYLSLSTNQPVSIHPSSVLFGRRVEAVVCSEFVFTTKSYARCLSAIELGWVREAQEVAVRVP